METSRGEVEGRSPPSLVGSLEAGSASLQLKIAEVQELLDLERRESNLQIQHLQAEVEDFKNQRKTAHDDAAAKSRSLENLKLQLAAVQELLRLERSAHGETKSESNRQIQHLQAALAAESQSLETLLQDCESLSKQTAARIEALEDQLKEKEAEHRLECTAHDETKRKSNLQIQHLQAEVEDFKKQQKTAHDDAAAKSLSLENLKLQLAEVQELLRLERSESSRQIQHLQAALAAESQSLETLLQDCESLSKQTAARIEALEDQLKEKEAEHRLECSAHDETKRKSNLQIQHLQAGVEEFKKQQKTAHDDAAAKSLSLENLKLQLAAVQALLDLERSAHGETKSESNRQIQHLQADLAAKNQSVETLLQGVESVSEQTAARIKALQEHRLERSAHGETKSESHRQIQHLQAELAAESVQLG